MSDDMEYIDSSTISVAARKRKPKYKYKIWESEDPKDQARYLLSCSKSNRRWQEKKYGFYNEDEDPFIHLVTDRLKYEIQCESVFHVDPESAEVAKIIAEEDAAANAAKIQERLEFLFQEAYELDAEITNAETEDDIYFMLTRHDILWASYKELISSMTDEQDEEMNRLLQGIHDDLISMMEDE